MICTEAGYFIKTLQTRREQPSAFGDIEIVATADGHTLTVRTISERLRSAAPDCLLGDPADGRNAHHLKSNAGRDPRD